MKGRRSAHCSAGGHRHAQHDVRGQGPARWWRRSAVVCSEANLSGLSRGHSVVVGHSPNGMRPGIYSL